jgi:uncharacterized protein (TIGR02996 family)
VTLLAELEDLRRHLPPSLAESAGLLAELAPFDDAVVRACDTSIVKTVTKPLAGHPLGAYVTAFLSRRASWISGASAARGVLSHTVKHYGDEGYLAIAWLAALPGDPPLLHVLLSHLRARVERVGEGVPPLPIERLAPAVVAGLTHRAAQPRITAAMLVRALGEPIRPFLVAARASSSSSRKRLFDAHLLELDRVAERDATVKDGATDADQAHPLRRASRHAEARDYAGLTLALREEWERSRSPKIAELCERASASVTIEVPVLPTRRAASSHWEALAERRDPASVPTLLAAPWPEDPKEAAARSALLARFPPDPRIAGAATTLLHEGRYRVFRGLVAEEALLTLLVAHADPRAAERLTPTLERLARFRDAASRRRLALLDGSALHEAIAALRLAPDSSDLPELEAVRAALRGAPAEVGEALLAAVYADPDDDAPRAVLADFLAERGDPRGEFIQLQLGLEAAAAPDPKRERRAASLLHALRPRWCEDLRGLRASTARFRRGFVDEGDLHLREGWTGAERSFATLRRAALETVDDPSLVRTLLAAEPFRGLQVLHGAPPSAFGPDDPGPWSVPVRVQHPALVELGLSDDRAWRDLDLSGLTALRRLVVPNFTVVARAVFPPSLEELAAFLGAFGPAAEPHAQAAAAFAPPTVRRIGVHRLAAPATIAASTPPSDPPAFALERGSTGEWRRATF